MSFGSLCLLLASNDGHHLSIIITLLLREDHSGTVLVTDFTDIGSSPSNEEAMELGLATDLNGVVRLGLDRDEQRERLMINSTHTQVRMQTAPSKLCCVHIIHKQYKGKHFNSSLSNTRNLYSFSHTF